MDARDLLRFLSTFARQQGDVQYLAYFDVDGDDRVGFTDLFAFVDRLDLAAYLNAEAALPTVVRDALEKATEIACGNVPELPGPIVIGLDVSGSMSSPVTGHRGTGSTSKMRCVDVAALFAAAVVRRNPDSVVVPFDTSAHEVAIHRDETILRLAARLANFGGGGTNCSLPLQYANTHLKDRAFAGCVLVSDCESWIGNGRGGQTATMTEWMTFVRNQNRLKGETHAPKLICIDLQAYTTSQAPDCENILNIGGFSDAVFGAVAGFLSDDGRRFVSEVEAIDISERYSWSCSRMQFDAGPARS